MPNPTFSVDPEVNSLCQIGSQLPIYSSVAPPECLFPLLRSAKANVFCIFLYVAEEALEGADWETGVGKTFWCMYNHMGQ